MRDSRTRKTALENLEITNEVHLNGGTMPELHVCCGCFEESHILKRNVKFVKLKVCSFCNKRARGLSLNILAEEIKAVVCKYYILTNETYESESGADFANVAYDLIKCDDAVAEKIRETLEPSYRRRDKEKAGERWYFCNDALYYFNDIEFFEGAYPDSWNHLCTSLQKDSRFFNHDVYAKLNEVFGDIGKLQTVEGLPLITEIGKGSSTTHIYRAREYQDESSRDFAFIRPDLELGAPPPLMTNGKGGRMNAPGISVFYGSIEQDTAIAELRPAVGSTVLTGKFKINRKLKMIDLTKFCKINLEGSYFDFEYVAARPRLFFLSELCDLLIKPVVPLREGYSYLITQAISDYLANSAKLNVDGVIFPSVQIKNGINAVLFHKSCKAKLKTPLRRTQWYTVNCVEGDSISVTLYTRKPKYTLRKLKSFTSEYDETDSRNTTLIVDHSDVKIHYVSSALYKTEPATVDVSTRENPSAMERILGRKNAKRYSLHARRF